MKRVKQKKNGNGDSNSESLFKPLAYVDVSSLTKLALPLTLNEYFLPFIENIKDCLLFLERFSLEDETISKLLDTYNNDKAFSKTSDTLDLDLLATKSGLSKGEFRRLIVATLDILGDEEALMILRQSKKHLVSKSIQIALTDQHPDSYNERHSLLQFYGFHPVPKNSAVNVNIDNSKNLALSQTQIGLPSFSSTIQASEKIAAEKIKDLIDKEGDKMKQLNASSISIPLYTDATPVESKVDGLDGFEDDEMEEED